MYKGANKTQASSSKARGSTKPKGSTKTKNAKGSGKPSTRKKKNPSPLTWIVGGIIGAAAIGGGIAYGVYRRRRKALKPKTTPDVLPEPKKPGKKNAPPFPYSESEARDVEVAWGQAAFAEISAQAAAQGQPIPEDNDTLNRVTDEAFWEAYPALNRQKIPTKRNRGTGWQPYIDSWLRIRDHVRDLIQNFNAALAS